MTRHWTRTDIQQALTGNRRDREELWNHIFDHIHHEVGHKLRRCTRTALGDLRREADDLVQASALAFLEHPERTLLRWDPERMSLSGFIGVIVRFHTLRRLRTLRRASRTTDRLDPADVDELLVDAGTEHASLDAAIDHAQHMLALRACVDDDLGERDRRIYRGYYVDERPAADLMVAETLTESAFHQCLKRIRDRLRQCIAEKNLSPGRQAAPPPRQEP